MRTHDHARQHAERQAQSRIDCARSAKAHAFGDEIFRISGVYFRGNIAGATFALGLMFF